MIVPGAEAIDGARAGTAEGNVSGRGLRPRLLVFAYACEPGRGSEPGAGWGLVQALAAFADCTVLVGSEHAAGLQRWQAAHPNEPGLEFIEVPERWISPPARRHRLTKFLLYLRWLRHAHRRGLAIHRQHPFTAVYHATYSTYWLPSPAVEYGVPCIWGPVGGAVTTPLPLWPMLGWSGIAGELMDLVAVRAFSRWPGTRRTWRRALVPIIQNQATLERLPADVRRRAMVMNHAMFTKIPDVPRLPREHYGLFVGALESRKGARLALHALSYTAGNFEMRIVGDGPERPALEALARSLGVASRVRFLGSLPREDVLRLVASAAAVVFTGLREEGGLALAEAMLLGAPVIVLAHGGAGTIAASGCDPSRVTLIAPGNRETTARRLGEAISRCCQDPASGVGPTLDVPAAHRALRAAVEGACRGAAQ